MTRIRKLVAFIYGEDSADSISSQIEVLIAEWQNGEAAKPRNVATSQPRNPASFFDQTDAILITYGDMVQTADEAPLQTLRRFLEQHIAGIVKGVHILPFYPYSSDDGFSVIDYTKADPTLGEWRDVEAFQQSFRLMFDAVINHISQHSEWFAAFKRGEEPYTNYFTVVEPGEDLSTVFRPRTLPLLTVVETVDGEKHVWTTFSPDQIDLNYALPDVLLDVLRVLLNYVSHGAELIRLDAIAYMWKEIGTRCIHLPQTHAIIQLMRAVLDEAAPHVALITETNVPHHENISYFGDGHNEAQMVYNFSLPPLTLHTFHTGDATALSAWAKTLEQPSDRTTFFNFCASHDGIGLTPARGILSQHDIEAMAQRVQALGGFVSYRNNPAGSQSAYELNINFMNALGVPGEEENDELMARRFLCSQAIMLALRGVPGIYFHSLFGSQNWLEGVAQTGRNRTINREKLPLKRLERELGSGVRKLVFDGYCQMLRVRSAEIAFHPNGTQTILDLHPSVVAIERKHNDETTLCLHNVSAQEITIDLTAKGQSSEAAKWQTIFSPPPTTSFPLPPNSLPLPPYSYLWLKPDVPIS